MFSTGIVAHAARETAAQALKAQVCADYMNVDDGTLGCSGNHRKVWEHLSHYGTAWSLVLEDDALPVAGFTDQLEQALSVAPTPIVSLYLGQGRPPQWQDRVGQAISAAERENACWIVGKRLLHGVAMCILTELVPSMLEGISERPIDWAVRDWAVQHGHDIGFTAPSLCDHADGPTLLTRTDSKVRDEQRTAWRTGTRDRWTGRSVTL